MFDSHLLGAVAYRAALSFYFALPLETAAVFNGIDIVVGALAYLIFKKKMNSPMALILGHGLSCGIALLTTTQLIGAMNPLAAVALTVGSVIISQFFLIIKNEAI